MDGSWRGKKEEVEENGRADNDCNEQHYPRDLDE
jgi:hypothetical protein